MSEVFLNLEEENPENEPLDDNNKADTITDTILGKSGLWDGERKNVTIKIDKDLYKAFKPIAQARFGSVCCAMEGMMAGIVGAVHYSKVSMGNSITIDGGMHVHRTGLKERRRLDPLSVTEKDAVDVAVERVADWVGAMFEHGFPKGIEVWDALRYEGVPDRELKKSAERVNALVYKRRRARRLESEGGSKYSKWVEDNAESGETS